MHDTRVWYASQVLRDGRVLVGGCEAGNGTGGNNAEVYDPLSNAWTYTGSPQVGINDAISMVLPDGRVLVWPVSWGAYPPFSTVIYDPATNGWSVGPATSGSQNEVSWVKLPDDSILTIDQTSTATERFIPSLNQWIADKPAPMIWNVTNSEIGPGLLLPNGKAFFIGGNGQTAIYTPSGSTNLGSWINGITLTNGMTAQDAPGAIMPNGKILCALSSDLRSLVSNFYEYDYLANVFAQVSGPTGLVHNVGTFQIYMLDLPDGTVLCALSDPQLYIYTRSGPPLAAAKPTIRSITAHPDGSFHLTGTQLNGISAGAAYGDDGQMDSNYPLVRLTNSVTHNVYYARTYNWSSTSVQTGTKVVSTEFTLPQQLPSATYSLVAVANGIASDPVTFYGPVWVDFNYTGSTQNGSFNFPFKTLTNGVSACPTNGTIICKGPASHRETPQITKAMTIVSYGGAVTVGR
jgi:hypothetical protein